MKGTLHEKCPNTEFYSGLHFPAFRLNMEKCEVSILFSPNAGKYGPEKTPNLDTFHAILVQVVKTLCKDLRNLLLLLYRFRRIRGTEGYLMLFSTNWKVDIIFWRIMANFSYELRISLFDFIFVIWFLLLWSIFVLFKYLFSTPASDPRPLVLAPDLIYFFKILLLHFFTALCPDYFFTAP